MKRYFSQHDRLGAFNQFVLRHQSMVYNLSSRILGDQELAAQVTQDTFSRSFSIFSKPRGESAKLWLARIVADLCHGRLRQVSSCVVDIQADSNTSQRYLGDLPHDQRIAIELSDILELNYTEIAQVTGVSVRVVRTRLSQGRARLRDALLVQNEMLLEDDFAWPESCGFVAASD